MKIPKILLIAVSVIFVVIVLIFSGIIIFVNTFDIKKFQPQIVSQVQDLLGREVSLKDLSLSFSITEGLAVSIEDLKISDDPSFSKESFFSVSKAQVGLDLIPTIKDRQIFVSGIEFIEPSISIIRNSQGVFNFQTFKFLKPSFESSQAEATSANGKFATNLSAAAGLPLVLIKHAAIKEGNLSFFDRSGSDPVSIKVSKIFFGVNDFSLTNAFNFVLESAVFSDEKNIKVDGKVKIDLKKPAVYLRDTNFKLNLASLNPKKIAEMLPPISQLELTKNPKGTLSCTIDLMEMSPNNINIVYLKAGLENGEIQSGRLSEVLSAIMAEIEVKEDNLSINEISAKLGDGNILAKGSVLGYQNDQQYDVSLDVSNIDLGKTIDQDAQDIKLLGLLSTSAEIKGKGFLSLLSFQPEMGKQKLTLKDGKLENINILKIVLSKLNFVPDLIEKLEQNLPEKYKEKLQQDDTPLTNVEFSSYIEGGKIYLDSMNVATDAFSLGGKGTLDFDLNADIHAQIAIAQDLSKAMVDSTEEFSYLMDENEEIVIPVMITGKAPDKLVYFPDLGYIGKKVLRNKGKQELKKVLGKFLKIGDDSDESSGSSQGDSESEQESSSGDKIIGNVLDMIFK